MNKDHQFEPLNFAAPSPAVIEAHIRRAHAMRSAYIAKQISALGRAASRTARSVKIGARPARLGKAV